MAFVFRSKTNTLKITPSPGPGQYKYQDKNKQIDHANVPFNQSSPRKIWNENTLPGPGAYQIQQHKSNYKAVIKNGGNAYAIYEAPIQSSIFKSNSKRFCNQEETNPGPGQYIVRMEKQVKERINSQPNSLYKYLQKTKSQNGVDADLELLAIGEQQEVNRQSITKSFSLKKNEKKSIPFQTLQERYKPIRPQTSLGPGSYQINQPNQSKMQFNRKKNSQSITKFKKISPQCEKQCKKIIQNILIDNQGNRISGKKSFNKKKDDFFGSCVSRFSNPFKQYTPGPGQYELQGTKSASNGVNIPIKKPAFGRSSQDFSKQNQVFVSPFKSINHKQHSQAKKNIKKKASQGCFLFKQPRFKEVGNSNTQISTFMPNEIFLGKQNKQNSHQTRKVFSRNPKILIKREIPKKNESDERPLSYATQAFTIAGKNKEKIQINAPFLSYASRFNENEKKDQVQNIYLKKAFATESKEKDNLNDNNRSFNSKGLMSSSNPRFHYKESQNQLSPFTYNPAKPKTKQFNKLFQ